MSDYNFSQLFGDPINDSYMYEGGETPFAAERWDITDIVSSLWKGTGETARLFGRGSGSETLEGIGTSISESDFAKPDESTYFGRDSYKKEILMGAAESAPLTAVLAGASTLGTMAGGPVGTVAGLTAAGSVLSRGLYLDNMDRYWEQHPDGTDEDAIKYSAMHAGVEALTEVGGAALGFGALKLGGQVAKPFLINAIEKGVISTADVLDTVAAKAGATTFMQRMFGATLPEGGEEVVASYLQHKLDTSYEMKTEAPDYFKTFLIGAVASGPFAIAGAKITSDQQNKIRNNIETGLQSEDKDQRLHTVKQVYDTIKEVSPEAALNWDNYASVAAVNGPLSLDGTVDPSLAWKKHLQEWQDSRRTKEELYEVTRDPAEILKGFEIPFGTADMQPVATSADPYGAGIAPPTASKIDQLLEENKQKAISPTLWQDYLKSIKGKSTVAEVVRPEADKTAQWKKPIYDNTAKLAAVEEEIKDADTNELPATEIAKLKADEEETFKARRIQELSAKRKAQLTPYEKLRLEELTGKEKLTLKEKKETKTLKAKDKAAKEIVVTEAKVEPTAAVAADVTPTTTVATVDDTEYSKDDLEGIEVDIPLGKNKKTGEIKWKKGVPAHDALDEIRKAEEKWQAVVDTATDPKIVEGAKNRLKQEGVRKAKIEEQIGKVAKTGTKESRIREAMIDQAGIINDPAVDEKLKEKAQLELDRLEKLLQVDKSGIAKGATTGVNTAGEKQVVEYSDNARDWKPVDKSNPNVLVNQNSIIIKNNDSNWSVFQRDEDGGLVPVGRGFKRKSHAIAALRAGQTKEEYYGANPEEAPKPLTDDQKKLVGSIKDVRKLIGSRINKITDLRGDPEADGIATEAIFEAAGKFKEGKGASFTTFATSVIDARLKEYNENRYKFETQGVESTESTTGTIESATRSDVYETPATEVQKQEKEAPPPVTKVDVSSLTEEEKARYGQGGVVKKRTLAEQKAELDAMRQAEKAADNKVDEEISEEQKNSEAQQDVKDKKAKAEAETKKKTLAEKEAKKKLDDEAVKAKKADEKLKKDQAAAKKVVDKDSDSYKKAQEIKKLELLKKSLTPTDPADPKSAKMQPPPGKTLEETLARIDRMIEELNGTKTDASPVILRRSKAKEAFVDTKKEQVLLSTEAVNKAREILDRVKGNKAEAYRVIESIKEDAFRESVRAQVEVMNYTNLSSIIKPFLNKDKSSQEYKLATWINKLILDSGKKNINVIVDPTAAYEQFSHAGSGTVIVKALNTTTVNLHEVMHAITSRELDNSPELKLRVRALMDLVEKAAIERSDIQIDKAMLKKLRSIEPTSAAFREAFDVANLGDHGGILYALLNEKEFLAQVMNDKAFQDLLLSTEVPVKSGFIKNLFDHVVEIFLQMFGKGKIQHNAMKEALQLMAELSRVNLAKGPVVSNQVDGLLVGERSQGIHLGTLLDAQFRGARGDNMETIRKGTGWYKDPIDDKWRFEISDHEAEWLNPWETLETYEDGTDGEFKLFDILIHDKLFEAYPELRNIMVYKEDFGRNSNILGEYRPYSRSIAVNSRSNSEEALSTIMHEIQHIIQFKEGFAKGGNTASVSVINSRSEIEDLLIEQINRRLDRGSDADNRVLPELRENLAEIRSIHEWAEENEDLLEELRDIEDELKRLEVEYNKDAKRIRDRIKIKEDKRYNTDPFDNSAAWEKLDNEIKSMYKSLDKLAKDSSKRVTRLASRKDDILDEVNYPTISDDLKYHAYSLIAGEAESRVIQKRMKWQEHQRKEFSPLESLDVPAEARILAPSDHSVSMSSMSKTPEKTEAERDKVLEANDVNATKIGAIKNFFTDSMSKEVKRLAMGMTEHLRRIDPRLLNYVRKFEMAIINYNVKYQRMADPFVKKFKKLSDKDKRMLGLVLLNNFPQDIEKRFEILKRNNMVSEYEKIVEILKDIQKRKKMVSIGDYSEIEGYFPRTIKDRMGLLQAMKKDPNYGVIDQELSEAGLDEADRISAIEKLLHTGRYPALALLKPGSSKKRRIERVSSEWAHFYENPIDSLLSHIYENNEAIEARNMFGDTRRKGLAQKRDEMMKELEADKLSAGKRKAIIGRIVAIEKDLDVYNDKDGKEGAWNEGIADLLSRVNAEYQKDPKNAFRYTENQQMEIIALIRARLTQRGMSGAWQTLRNVSLMTALGNPTSAITQLSDFAMSVHTNGLMNTVSSMFGDQIITTKDLDLSHSLREFQSSSSAAVLDKVLHFSGLKYMDLKAKNTFMNAAMKKAKSQTFEQFDKQWGSTLAGDTKQTYEELKEGKNSDRTRFFAFNALSEFQPVSLSEMPVGYLTAGNGRLFYALKSYNIKMINVYARKLFYGMSTAKNKTEKAAAIKDAMSLLILMTLAGAGADELKDLIMNRDVEFSDNVHNNILKAFFMNSYMLEQGSKKGIIKQMLTDTILPPTRAGDDALKDLTNLLDMDPDTEATMKFLKSVPWGGIVYAWTSEDADKVNYTNMKEGISKDIKSGDSISDVRSRMLKYNQWARGAGETLITYSSIKKMRNKKKDQKK